MSVDDVYSSIVSEISEVDEDEARDYIAQKLGNVNIESTHEIENNLGGCSTCTSATCGSRIPRLFIIIFILLLVIVLIVVICYSSRPRLQLPMPIPPTNGNSTD